MPSLEEFQGELLNHSEIANYLIQISKELRQ